MTDWVPLAACTLPTERQPLRVAEFAELFGSALRWADRRDETWLRLGLTDTGDVLARTRELTARESECCSFFTFDVRGEAGEVVLDVRVPAARAEVLDGLHRQAVAAIDPG